MTKRKTFKNLVTGVIAGGAVCALIVACSNSSTPAPPGSTTTPANATAETSPPYPSCTNLQAGCYKTNGNGAYAVPSTSSCAAPGKPAAGAADTHCVGQPPTTVIGGTCGGDAGAAPGDDAGAPSSDDAGDAGAPSSDDAGAQPAPGACGENGPDYGATMFGTDGDDDDCKYHVTYTASPICENNGTYFVVNVSYLAQSGPLVGACTLAELCLNDTHPAPAVDGRPPSGKQQVVEGPPGTYTIGPVQFDAPGDWTVRFHFNEFCCDVPGSPHGHAAFHVTVP
jgi:hypothetical protein